MQFLSVQMYMRNPEQDLDVCDAMKYEKSISVIVLRRNLYCRYEAEKYIYAEHLLARNRTH